MLFGLITVAQAQAPAPSAARAAELGPGEGAAFAMTNTARNNLIITYRRAADGTLTRVGSISTRGTDIGVDLDTQGGLRLSNDDRFLSAANAGSDDITVFAVSGTELTFVQRVFAGE